MNEQKAEFWKLLDIFDKEGLLPYVMLIGSWAEHIYQNAVYEDFKPAINTRDVDFIYKNINIPTNEKFNLLDSLINEGYKYLEHYDTGTAKFVKEDILEIEFLTRALGKGSPIAKIPSLDIKAESLRDINMLVNYPKQVTITNNNKKIKVFVPEPEAYVLQKIMINQTRKPLHKKEKDIQAIEKLLPYVDDGRLLQIFSELPKKSQSKITTTRDRYSLKLQMDI